MADPTTAPPLTRSSIHAAHARIKPYIHRTPLLTCKTLDRLASAGPEGLRLRLWFKCENMQKIGAFKARGAHNAVLRLVEELGIDEVRRRGVVTHSSGNHAQALALAAHTLGIPAYIVMPEISMKAKIEGTKLYTENVIFSGSTSQEREEVVRQVVGRTGAVLVPPYDHPDVVVGQGTVGWEMAEQLVEGAGGVGGEDEERGFDAVMVPLGGGGLLGGIATFFAEGDSDGDDANNDDNEEKEKEKEKKTYVFGCEPSHSGANDAQRGLALSPPQRIERVSTLTIADGLRTPVGVLNWEVISDKTKVEGVYSVSEDQIRGAMRLVLERLKVVVEPSAVVGLAVVLGDEGWRAWVGGMQRAEDERRRREGSLKDLEGEEGRVWDVGVVLSGGNTTVEAVMELFEGDTSRVMKGKGDMVNGTN